MIEFFKKRFVNVYRKLKSKGIELPRLEKQKVKFNLMVVTVVKNEGMYLKEWIDFHRDEGVEFFVIYDNGSSDDTKQVLKPYVDQGIVEIVKWRHFDAKRDTQLMAYAHALTNYGIEANWVGFFDVDEFMYCPKGEKVCDFLNVMRGYPVVGVVGNYFGTSGVVKKEGGSVIVKFTKSVALSKQRRMKQLLNIKCFVQPVFVERVLSAHFFGIKGTSYVAYSEKGLGIGKFPRDDPDRLSNDKIRYNHYYTKSLEEWNKKTVMGNVRGKKYVMDKKKYDAMFDFIEKNAEEDFGLVESKQM